MNSAVADSPTWQRTPITWRDVPICLLLIALTWSVFGQTIGFDFVNYDDNTYVGANALIQRGLSHEGLIKAFTEVQGGNWHPLTTLSHMLDCQLFGLQAGRHHAVNVVLHTIAVVLLFFFLRLSTGWLWLSAFVAAVFAVHPLRAESVAWISERKDVLSAVFFMLTLLAYVQYARRRSIWSYLLVIGSFILGLMSKPMLVTTPFVLLALDYWPLCRLAKRNWRFLLLEKIPLLVLSAITCVLTLWAQQQSVAPLESLPLLPRITNGIVGTVIYMRQLIWPSGLAVFYGYPTAGVGIWKIAAGATVLLLISVGAIVLRKEYPFLLTGWLWYLIMLLPVIGFVQVGNQSHADRYTYLPEVGLLLIVAGFIASVSVSAIAAKFVAAAAVACVIGLSRLGFHQVGYWRNSETLWRRAIAVTGDFHAHHNLGHSFLLQNRLPEAVEQFEITLKMKPDYADGHFNLGLVFERLGKLDESISQFAQAIVARPNYPEAYCRLGNQLLAAGEPEAALKQYRNGLVYRPNYPEVHYNIGMVLAQQRQLDEAVAEYEKAIKDNPTYAEAHYALGNALFQKGSVDGAISHYRAALKSRPDFAEVENNLAMALLANGYLHEAIEQWRKNIQLHPNAIQTMNNLAWVLATYPDDTVRNGRDAVRLAARAQQLSSNNDPVILRTLAAAYAEVGDFTKASEVAEMGTKLAVDQQNFDLVEILRADRSEYQTGKPVRTPPQPIR